MSLVIVVFFVVAGVLCLILLRRFQRDDARDPTGSDIAGEFDPERYGSFERLLSESDLQFLAAQPGYTPPIGREFRRRRAAVASLYLSEMHADFRSLCRRARAMAATSTRDRSDLVTLVEKEYLIFYYRLAAVRLRLALSSLGVPMPGRSQLPESLARIHGRMAEFGLPAPDLI